MLHQNLQIGAFAEGRKQGDAEGYARGFAAGEAAMQERAAKVLRERATLMAEMYAQASEPKTDVSPYYTDAAILVYALKVTGEE